MKTKSYKNIQILKDFKDCQNYLLMKKILLTKSHIFVLSLKLRRHLKNLTTAVCLAGAVFVWKQ